MLGCKDGYDEFVAVKLSVRAENVGICWLSWGSRRRKLVICGW